MLQFLKLYWQNHPFRSVMWLALIARCWAAIFSPGYGMHDDHFLVIEAAQSWVDGFDYNDWLPGGNNKGAPTGHSMFYVGLHYFFFLICRAVGLHDPEVKMLLVRLLHAAYASTAVYFLFRIAYARFGLDTAKKAGLIVALIWFLPNLSVRNLVEVVSIPPILAASWLLVKPGGNSIRRAVLAGLVIGFAVSFRFHSVLFVGGIGLALLIRKEWLAAISFGLGAGVTVFATQLTDLYTWGYPFAEFREYIHYNLTHKNDYITQGVETYFLLISGILIPPVSLMLIFGFVREWRQQLILFLPALIFFAFHTYFPNKQERFIIPVIPFVVLLGVQGWNSFRSGSPFWSVRSSLERRIWQWFWGVNLLLLVLVSSAYSKRSRVETMLFLSHQPDYVNMYVERSHSEGEIMLPRYYLQSWKGYYDVLAGSRERLSPEFHQNLDPNLRPNYIVFLEEIDLENRVASARNVFPNMRLVTEIQPSFLDRILHFLNPVNKNESTYIYHI